MDSISVVKHDANQSSGNTNHANTVIFADVTVSNDVSGIQAFGLMANSVAITGQLPGLCFTSRCFDRVFLFTALDGIYADW